MVHNRMDHTLRAFLGIGISSETLSPSSNPLLKISGMLDLGILRRLSLDRTFSDENVLGPG